MSTKCPSYGKVIQIEEELKNKKSAIDSAKSKRFRKRIKYLTSKRKYRSQTFSKNMSIQKQIDSTPINRTKLNENFRIKHHGCHMKINTLDIQESLISDIDSDILYDWMAIEISESNISRYNLYKLADNGKISKMLIVDKELIDYNYINTTLNDSRNQKYSRKRCTTIRELIPELNTDANQVIASTL